MRLLPLLLAPVAALALSGCTLGGGATADESVPGVDGPHFLLTLDNQAPHEVSVRYALEGADASSAEGDLVATAADAVETAVPVPEEGFQRLRIAYQWSDAGRAAGGTQEIQFDTRECDGPVRVTFVVAKSDDGVTFSRFDTVCAGSA